MTGKWRRVVMAKGARVPQFNAYCSIPFLLRDAYYVLSGDNSHWDGSGRALTEECSWWQNQSFWGPLTNTVWYLYQRETFVTGGFIDVESLKWNYLLKCKFMKVLNNFIFVAAKP